MVIGHQAIIRCISGYFFNVDLKQLPHIPVPLHLLIKLTPDNYTFSELYVKTDLETGKILSINKAEKKKFSVDFDGSQSPRKVVRGKFKSVKSDNVM
jgi:broad specificity phosphatase PhoE